MNAIALEMLRETFQVEKSFTFQSKIFHFISLSLWFMRIIDIYPVRTPVTASSQEEQKDWVYENEMQM